MGSGGGERTAGFDSLRAPIFGSGLATVSPARVRILYAGGGMEIGDHVPYIKPEERAKIQVAAEALAALCGSPGQLNYGITVALHAVLMRLGKGYSNAASLVAALECAKMEFYRRVMAPYEDMKTRQNGDVVLSDGTNVADL